MTNINKNTLVCFGEVLWDVLPTHKVAGGAPMNVAFHANNFGLNAHMISAVGNDALGRELLDFLRQKNISTALIDTNTTYPTSTVQVTLNEKGSASYEIVEPVAWDFLFADELREKTVAGADLLLFGSLICRNKNNVEALLTLIDKAPKTAFDVNLRPPFYQQSLIETLLYKADIIKMNEEELAIISNWYGVQKNEEAQLIFLAENFNAETLILTKGAHGAACLHNKELFTHKSYPVKVQDTVGSGDSFLAGFLYKMLAGFDWQTCLEFACATGALVATHSGGTPSITEAAVEAFIQENSMERQKMKNQVQLITYVDRIGCKDLTALKDLIQNQLKGLFGGVHLLPFYYPIDGEDAGFDPINHKQIDPRLGDWADLRALSGEIDIMADLIVNHVSAKSVEFQDYLQKGKDSEYASLFLSYETAFPNGATEADLLAIYRPRPSLPFTLFKFKDGSSKLIWTTFTSNQVDIDVNSPGGKQYLENILNTFQKGGIKMIRLDAAGYAIKKQGTSCFMIEETFEFISELSELAKSRGIEVLVEIHSYYKTQIEIAKRVDYVYDFALPVLVLDTLFNKNTTSLKKWLAVSPRNAISVLDTHDGIGIVDVASEDGKPGLIEDEVLDNIVKQMHLNSKGDSLKATGAAASNLDLYQVNCTYFDALGRDENAYLLARAIQFFVPGIPQVYYVGLFAGENDMELLAKTNVGRDINRHYYTMEEIDAHLQRPILKEFKKLMLLRNNHPAFNGEFKLVDTAANILHLQWENQADKAELHIELDTMSMNIHFTKNGQLSHLKNLVETI